MDINDRSDNNSMRIVVAGCCVLAVALGGTFVSKSGVVCEVGKLLESVSCRPPSVIPANNDTRLLLSTPQVRIGDNYLITALNFSPGENVRFSWTGPSNGVITDVSVDSSGTASTWVSEHADPGDYIIIATGLTSGRTASAMLRVFT